MDVQILRTQAMDRHPCVYIMASSRNGTLYTGVTSDLVGRVWQHREHLAQGFTAKYDVTRLVWFETHHTMESAIQREKRIKKWNRDWKLRLVDGMNPSWRDLWPDITEQVPTAMPMDSRLRGNDGQGRGNDGQGQARGNDEPGQGCGNDAPGKELGSDNQERDSIRP